jgi:hypothetical protein
MEIVHPPCAGETAHEPEDHPNGKKQLHRNPLPGSTHDASMRHGA